MMNDLACVDYSYSKGVNKNADIYFLAGACPLNAEGIVPFENDYAKQAELCLENALAVLKSKNMGMQNICFLRVLVALNMQSDLVVAWDKLIDLIPEMPPATLQGVSVLGYDNQLVELEITAYLDAEN